MVRLTHHKRVARSHDNKKAAGRGLHVLRRSPEGGAYEFCILLWKTHRHRSVTIRMENSRDAGESQEGLEKNLISGGHYEHIHTRARYRQ